jgi:two-component system chemotaxis response regulator CheB
VVQDPATAACADMPASAVANVRVDHVVPLEEMPALLVRLAAETAGETGATNATAEATEATEAAATGATGATGATDTGGLAMSVDVHSGSEEGPVPTTPNGIERKEAEAGPPTGMTCPECGGALWEERVEGMTRYSCHVGHGYTGDSLEDQYAQEVEAALWTAMRQLVEAAELHRRLARRMRERGPAERAEHYEQQAAETERRAAVIRDLLVNDRVGGLVRGMTKDEIRMTNR